MRIIFYEKHHNDNHESINEKEKDNNINKQKWDKHDDNNID